MAEEGSNPVIFGSDVYVGYTEGSNAIVVHAPNGKLGAPVTIPGGGVTSDLRLRVSHQHVYAAWHAKAQRLSSLMFAVSNDHGATWSTPMSLGATKSMNSEVSADDRNVHIIYGLPDNTIVVTNSGDTGKTFDPPIPLGHGQEAVIASSGTNVYAAWEDASTGRDVMVAASHDGGKDFIVNDVSRPAGLRAREPIFSLDSKSGRLSLVWRTDDPAQAVYLQSSDGVTWSSPITIDTPVRQVMVADAGNNDIYITYLRQSMVNGVVDWQIYLSTSKDGGQTFSPGRRLGRRTGITSIKGDIVRPIPWARGPNFTIAGMKADGAYVWSGQNRTIIGRSKYLGAGTFASPAGNSVGWQGPDGIMYADCHYARQR